jgi:hypothetical protein
LRKVFNEKEFKDYIKKNPLTTIRTRDYDEMLKFKTEVEAFYPCEIKVTMSEEDGKYYFEFVNLFLVHANLEFRISMNRKQYEIYCLSFSDLKNISHYDIQRCNEGLKVPNNIWKLNKKKIFEHIRYNEKLYVKALAVSIQHEAAEQVFLHSIEDLPVKWRTENKSGWVILNGIEFSFNIENGHIQQSMKIAFIPSTLENFRKLSDNKF